MGLKATDVTELPIPQGLGFLWGGTYATVDSYLKPLGFELAGGGASDADGTYTKPNLLNGAYLRSVATGGDAPGGSVVTGGSHAHSFASHNHTHGGVSSGGSYPGANPNGISDNPHTHPVSSVGDTISSVLIEPYYTQVIPVVYCKKPTGTGGPRRHDYAADALIDQKLIGFWHSSSAVPTGYAECTGQTVNSVVTIDLQTYFPRGIPNTSTDPAVTGGAATHSHNVQHYHGTTNSGATWDTHWADPSYGYCNDHNHGNTSTDSQTSGTATNNPDHILTRFITFTGYGTNQAAAATGVLTSTDLDASLTVPRGLMMMFGHALSGKPAKWAHADGGAFTNGNPSGHTARPNLVNRFPRLVPNSTTNGGGTGGTDGVHNSHTLGGHAHTLNAAPENRDSYQSAGTAARVIHTHTTSGTTLSTEGNGTYMPSHKTVAFLVRD